MTIQRKQNSALYISRRTAGAISKGCILATALLAISFGSSAQNLRTELKGEYKITPVERAAERPTAFSPDLFVPKFKKISLTPGEYTTPSELTRELARLDPAPWLDTIAITPYRGYASVGYFPAYNLGVSAGYRILNTARTRVGAWMQFNGSSYKADMAANALQTEKLSKETFKSNTATVSVRLDHRVNPNSQLTARGGFSYGHFTAPSFGKDFKTPVLDFGAGVEWWSKIGKLGYHVNAAIDRFDYNFDYDTPNPSDFAFSKIKGMKETDFSFGAGAVYGNLDGNAWGGLEVKGLIASRSNTDGPKTISTIGLTPYFGFDAESFHGRLGVNVDFSRDGKTRTHISPAVKLTWLPLSQLTVFADITGGDRLNTLRNSYTHSIWTNPIAEHGITQIPVDAKVGLNFGPFSGLSVEIFGAYSAACRWEAPVTFDKFISSDRSALNNLNVVQNLHGIRYGANVKYQYRSYVTAEIGYTGIIDSDEADRGYYLWLDRAKSQFKARLEVKPISALGIEASFTFRNGRHTYVYSDQAEESPISSSLGIVRDLGFGATYNFSDRLAVFVKAENVLNQHYDIFFNTPSQGVKGLAGLSYQF